MSPYDDLWSGTALRQFEALPTAIRDQVEATVRQICCEPGTIGIEIIGEQIRPRPLYAARAGSVLVVYQIDTMDEMVHIMRIVNRG